MSAGTIAIDVGGTFTDITFAGAGTGATWVAKTPSGVLEIGRHDIPRHDNSVPRPVRANVRRHGE